MTGTRDPYYEWLGIPPKDQPPSHYRLLGLEDFEENRHVIASAADRQMSFVKSYQGGDDSELSQAVLNELSAARLCLLNPQKKAAYDDELRLAAVREIAIPKATRKRSPRERASASLRSKKPLVVKPPVKSKKTPAGTAIAPTETAKSPTPKESPGAPGVFVDAAPRSRVSSMRSRRKRFAAPLLLLAAGGGVAIVVLVAALALNSQSRTEESSEGKSKPAVAQGLPPADWAAPKPQGTQAKPPQVDLIDDVAISVDDVLLVSVDAVNEDDPSSPLRYELAPGAPTGARIRPETGEISWTPNELDVGKSHPFTVWVNAEGDGPRATIDFQVSVTPSQVDQGRGTPMVEQAEQSEPMKVAATRSLADLMDTPPAKTATSTLPQTAKGGFTEDEINTMLELYDSRSLFSTREYPGLRRIFADRFERQNEQEIKDALGADHESISTWLEENRVLKEELYTAIDPDVDDVRGALQIFRELKEQFPDKIVPYGNLAIAIAVTWDDAEAIYDYAHHQKRAKATMPEGLTDPALNFDYFLKTEQFMQGRGRWLPWEFLVHVVNHKTPIAEREWALKNYLPKRMMIGKCYAEVPYDHVMLETDSAEARMNGQAYTLANLSERGGVCAHQADYASRVGKSLAVPAAYVGGESAYGDLHAWVMWVELKAVTSKSIVFSLESHGRYRGDKYYVGKLKDPKSGKQCTDRQLELRLHTVGMDPVAKRHSDAVMAAYPVLREKLELGINDQFSFMSRAINLCPGNEEAWTALAGMTSNEVVRTKHRKQMTGILSQLFNNFANFPDFTWTIFDDLIGYEERLKERIKLYERLVLLYQMAERPDLACEARLRLTDLLVEDKRAIEAVDGLAGTIHVFVDEGRYVPRMLDRIEEICQDVDGATPHLLRFYASFLPKIPQMRGNRPSKYCMEMFRRGIDRFRKHGELAAARAFEAQLTQIEAGRGRRS